MRTFEEYIQAAAKEKLIFMVMDKSGQLLVYEYREKISKVCGVDSVLIPRMRKTYFFFLVDGVIRKDGIFLN